MDEATSKLYERYARLKKEIGEKKALMEINGAIGALEKIDVPQEDLTAALKCYAIVKQSLFGE